MVSSICCLHALESKAHLEEYVVPSEPQTGELSVAHKGHSKINIKRKHIRNGILLQIFYSCLYISMVNILTCAFSFI